MVIKPIRTNFIYPEIKESDRVFGASIIGTVIRTDGDWRAFLPPTEDQNIKGVESSACYVEAQQHTISTIQEAQHKVIDTNYSARFNALLSDGTEIGGDPVKGAKSIKYDGLVYQKDMDWDGIDSWGEFHSWEGVDEAKVKAKGKEWLKQWGVSFKIIVEKDLPLETKYIKLKEALKYSPVPLSVVAWYERNGMYFKPKGMRDNHLVEAVYLDEQNRVHVRDTYAPYEKILEPNYDFEFAMYWNVNRVGTKKNWLCDILGNIFR